MGERDWGQGIGRTTPPRKILAAGTRSNAAGLAILPLRSRLRAKRLSPFASWKGQLAFLAQNEAASDDLKLALTNKALRSRFRFSF